MWQKVLKFLDVKRSTSISRDHVDREDKLMSRIWDDQMLRESGNWWLGKLSSKRKWAKSLDEAETFKDLGNKEFQAKRYAESIEFYTKSALYAPLDSSQLPIAFANRSASLFYLNRYDECVRDIQLAIKFNYPKQLYYKLYLRTIQCYLKLGEQRLAEETLSKLQRIIDNPDYIKPSMRDGIEQKMREVKLTEPATSIRNAADNNNSFSKARSEIVFTENRDFPGASECIDAKYNDEMGRYVVANKPIKRGDVLFVEKPVSFVLRNEKATNDHCHYCNRITTDIPVPCTTCSDTMYCNEKCLNEAWSSYHRWECPGFGIGLWREIGIGHLALKVLLVCTTTADRARFNDMQNLRMNFSKRSINDLTSYGTTAVMLTTYLSKYTTYFMDNNNIKDCLMAKFDDQSFNSNFDVSTDAGRQLYISCLLLRHILQIINNGHAITRTVVSLNESDSSMDDDIIATGIYPSASRMNHSCDPNIINIFVDHYLIVKASRDIGHGEEIFNCYGPHYRHMTTNERQEHLKNHYLFICKCNACVKPKLQYFVERFSGMKCSKCDGAICEIKDFMYCLDCGSRSRDSILRKVVVTESMFNKAQVLFDSGKLDDALNMLKKCLKLQRAVLYKYNVDITATLNLMAKVYKMSGKWVDSIKCLKETLPAITERCGSYSWEMLDQLNDLIDTCFLYFESETNNASYTYKSTLKNAENHIRRMEDIANFNCGSWTNVYQDIKAKQQRILLLKET